MGQAMVACSQKHWLALSMQETHGVYGPGRHNDVEIDNAYSWEQLATCYLSGEHMDIGALGTNSSSKRPRLSGYIGSRV